MYDRLFDMIRDPDHYRFTEANDEIRRQLVLIHQACDVIEQQLVQANIKLHAERESATLPITETLEQIVTGLEVCCEQYDNHRSQ